MVAANHTWLFKLNLKFNFSVASAVALAITFPVLKSHMSMSIIAESSVGSEEVK